MKVKIINSFLRIIDSSRFFKAIMALFAVESAWIACSAVYPQAFDEDFHLGLIRIYARHLSPFLSHQPAGSARYGAVAQDPSYLFHYLMSFPYRLVALLTSDQTLQIVSLRIVDIILFGGGLILFKKLLMRAGVSRRLVNVSLLIFILVPIVPQLAGQINYDDLLFLMVPLSCLIAFDCLDGLKKKIIPYRSLFLLLSVCMLASLVTYAFLPVFLAEILFLIGFAAINFWRHQLPLKNISARNLKASLTLPNVIIALLFLLSSILFLQRYGLNIIHYHSINPDCAKILSVKECSQYKPWYYDYTNRQTVKSKGVHVSRNLIYYLGQWIYWMWFRLFFAVNGPRSSFRNYPPLPLPALGAILLTLGSAYALIRYWRKVLVDRSYNQLLLLIFALYAGSLFIKGFVTYTHTSVRENMNGRYLLAVLPLLIPALVSASQLALSRKEKLRQYLMLFIVVMFLEGGGTLTFIVRSNKSWDWHSPTVVRANNAARDVTHYLIIKGSKYYSGKMWFFD